MIRSCRIPPVLNRICDEQIPTAMLVTLDGELLGTSNSYPPFPSSAKDPSSLGTLLADIGMEYKKLGDEYAAITTDEQRRRQQQQQQQQQQQHQQQDGRTSTSTATTSLPPSSSSASSSSSSSSRMEVLLMHFDHGAMAAVTACDGIDCFLVAVAKPDTPPGLLRARLRSLADHVQESMSLLMESH